MNSIPEFAHTTGEAKAIRPSIMGEYTYRRIPIRRRQLKHEIENFVNWIIRITEGEEDMMGKHPDYIPFFGAGKTALLIVAFDRDEYVQAEIGTEEQIQTLMQHLASTPRQNGGDYNTPDTLDHDTEI